MSGTDASAEGLSDLLGKLEPRDDRRPPPELAALASSGVQRSLGMLLPLVGVNVVLAGFTELHALAPAHDRAIAATTLAAAASSIAWGLRRAGHRRSVRSIYIAGGFGLVLLVAFTGLGLPTGAPVALGLAYALTRLVRRGDAAPGAVALYLLYVVALPWLLGIPAGALLTLLDALTVVPMLVIFLRARIRLAAVAAILAIAVLAWRDRQSVLALLVVGTGLVLAVVYELRIPNRHVSQLRTAIDHALVALLAYVALRISPVPAELGAWPWALAVLGYEVVQAWRERLRAPARLAVAAAALAIATWHSGKLTLQDQIAVSLACAAALGAAGAWVGSRFLTRTALLVAAPGAVAVLHLAGGPWTPAPSVLGLLTTVLGLLVARERIPPSPYAWWRGFLREEHLALLKRALAAFGNAVLRIPVVGPILQAGRTAYDWVRHLDRVAHLGVNGALHGAAHVYGALVVSIQVRAGAELHWNTGCGTVLPVVVWAVWGLTLVELGVRGQSPWRRALGVTLMLAPWLAQGTASAAPTPRAVAAVVTGAALALAGASVSRVRGAAGGAAGGAAEANHPAVTPPVLSRIQASLQRQAARSEAVASPTSPSAPRPPRCCSPTPPASASPPRDR